MLNPQFKNAKVMEELLEKLRSTPLSDALVAWANARVAEEVKLRQEAEEKCRRETEAARRESEAAQARAAEAVRKEEAAMSEAARMASEVAGLVSAHQEAAARAESAEVALTASRNEAAAHAVESESKLSAALSQIAKLRGELETSNAGTGQARLEVERLRAQLLATPHPAQFAIDVVRDRRGLVQEMQVLIGTEKFRVNVTRNAVGKIKEMKRAAH